MSMGFIFDNKHSGDMGVVFKSTDRTLLPAKRVTQYTIPGKSGTYDIEDGYENREIVCTVAFVGEGYHYAGVRTRARAVAEWLSGEGLLVFDDEPERRTPQRSSAVSLSSKSPLRGRARYVSCVSRSPSPCATISRT